MNKLLITPLMEQQMFDDWCPYSGNPDPRTVWSAAIQAVNGFHLTASQPKEPEQSLQVTDEENEQFSRDVSNFKGADPEATKYALETFLRNRALEQPEQASPMSEPNRAIAYAASSKLHEIGYRYLDGKWMQPKEPEQEPVAWLNPIDGEIYKATDHEQIKWLQGLIPLTTPSQRKQLTDEELKLEFEKLYPNDIGILELAENNKDFAVEAIGARHHLVAFKAGAKAIEAAHGIKE